MTPDQPTDQLPALPEGMECATCTLCSKVESEGFFTGCLLRDCPPKDYPLPGDWTCDGKGNLTRPKSPAPSEALACPEIILAGWEKFTPEVGVVYQYPILVRPKTSGKWGRVEAGSDFDKFDIEDNYFARRATPPNPSGTEAQVCADIAARQQKGIAKYGTTVADNPLSIVQWLQHAYEESLDLPIYLKRAITALATPPAGELSETPRTDAEQSEVGANDPEDDYVRSSFARQLERELAALRQELAAAKAERNKFLESVERISIKLRSDAENQERAAIKSAFIDTAQMLDSMLLPAEYQKLSGLDKLPTLAAATSANETLRAALADIRKITLGWHPPGTEAGRIETVLRVALKIKD